MRQWTGILRHFRGQPPDHGSLLVIIPSLTLVFLSLIVRTASSAIDPTLEKKKVVEQLRQRLSEAQNDEEIKITLTAKSASQKSAGILPGTFVGCPADPSSPDQCIVDGPGREIGTFDPACGSGLAHIKSTLPWLTPQATNSQSSLGAPPGGAESEGRARAERQESRDATFAVSFRVQAPGPLGETLAKRVVNLTIAFEHGGLSPDQYFGTVAGDLDGQGLSFGILQWNLGSCSLQPLLAAFRRKDGTRFRTLMGTGAGVMDRLIAAPCDDALALARRVVLDADGQVKEPWVTRFHALGREQVFQEVQVQSLLPQVQKAYSLAEEFGFRSERAVALFFDILVQNGGISPLVRMQYEEDLQDGERSLGRALDEVERMRLLANRQAEAANPQWVDTVRARKLTIVQGEGSVNGISYNLDALGIRLRDYKTGKAVSHHNKHGASGRLTRGELRG
jgi:hypothetical protein